jgi:hypothetical protein
MSAQRGQVTVKEWRWLLIWALTLMLFTSLPYLWGWRVSSPERVFSGFMYNVEDGNSYIAKMQQGARGEWLFRLPYTPEEHDGALVYLHFLLLGRAAHRLGLPLVLAYHLARLGAAALLLAATYWFVAWLTAHTALRRVTTLLVAFGGGLGWLWVAGGQPPTLGAMPIDLWVPDGFAFLAAYALPHVCLSQALMLWALRWGLQALVETGWRRGLAAGLVAGLASLVHPFVAPLAVALLGLYAAWRSARRRRPFWPQVAIIALVGLPAAPYLIYLLIVFRANPVFAAWQAQNLTLSPAPLHYLLGYGLVGLLALAGGAYVWRRGDERQAFLLVWALAAPVLLYLPINLQRRALEGYQTPLATLAAFGLARYGLLPFSRWSPVRWLTRFRRYTLPRMRRFAVTAVVLAALPTNLFLVLGHIGQVNQKVSPAFQPGAVVRAVDWLGRRTDPGETVLAAFRSGNYIPARAGNRVFAGHGPETVDSLLKQEMLRCFFAAETDDAFRRDLLRDFGIVYVFYGPDERAAGGFQPAAAAYLTPVYDESGVVIYRVVPGGQ